MGERRRRRVDRMLETNGRRPSIACRPARRQTKWERAIERREIPQFQTPLLYIYKLFTLFHLLPTFIRRKGADDRADDLSSAAVAAAAIIRQSSSLLTSVLLLFLCLQSSSQLSRAGLILSSSLPGGSILPFPTAAIFLLLPQSSDASKSPPNQVLTPPPRLQQKSPPPTRQQISTNFRLHLNRKVASNVGVGSLLFLSTFLRQR